MKRSSPGFLLVAYVQSRAACSSSRSGLCFICSYFKSVEGDTNMGTCWGHQFHVISVVEPFVSIVAYRG